MHDATLQQILKQAFLRALTENAGRDLSTTEKLAAAYHELEVLCSVNSAFVKFCLQPSLDRPGRNEPVNARLRSSLFEDIFHDVFDDDYPTLSEEYNALFGRYDEQRHQYLARYQFEQFFRACYTNLFAMPNRADRFNGNALLAGIRVAFRSASGDVFTTMLWHYKHEIYVEIRDTDAQTGEQKKSIVAKSARAVLGERFAAHLSSMVRSGVIGFIDIVRANGTIFDGRTAYEVLEPYKDRIGGILSSASAKMVRLLYGQKRDPAFWLRVLKENYEEDGIAFTSLVALAYKLHQDNALDAATATEIARKWAHVFSDEQFAERTDMIAEIAWIWLVLLENVKPLPTLVLLNSIRHFQRNRPAILTLYRNNASNESFWIRIVTFEKLSFQWRDPSRRPDVVKLRNNTPLNMRGIDLTPSVLIGLLREMDNNDVFSDRERRVALVTLYFYLIESGALYPVNAAEKPSEADIEWVRAIPRRPYFASIVDKELRIKPV